FGDFCCCLRSLLHKAVNRFYHTLCLPSQGVLSLYSFGQPANDADQQHQYHWKYFPESDNSFFKGVVHVVIGLNANIANLLTYPNQSVQVLIRFKNVLKASPLKRE